MTYSIWLRLYTKYFRFYKSQFIDKIKQNQPFLARDGLYDRI